MSSALSALDRASSERSRAEAGCRGCVSCLFQNCGQLTGSCCMFHVAPCSPCPLSRRPPSELVPCLFSPPAASPAAALSEPSCDAIGKAQKIQDEAERSWALSQACAYYQHRCPAGELDKESCIRIMGESCSARVLQCSLLNTMQNLEPATQTHVEGERRLPHEDSSLNAAFLPPLTAVCPCPSSSVWSEAVRCAKQHPASLQDRGRLSCTAGQLALAGQPAAGRWSDVRRCLGGELLGGHRRSLFRRVSVVHHFLSILVFVVVFSLSS